MNTAAVTRSDLAWALGAALPHAGKRHGVSLYAEGGTLYVASTDDYTAGIAVVDCDAGLTLDLELTPSEAKDLARSVKPQRKADEVEAVALLQHDGLHVAVGDNAGEVYDASPHTGPGDSSLCWYLFRYVRLIEGWERDKHALIYDPVFLTRFAKAAKPGDRIRIQAHGITKAGISRAHGIGLIAVGSRFVGAVAGVGYAWTEKVPAVYDVLRLLPTTERKAS